MTAYDLMTADEMAAALAVRGCTFLEHGEGGVEFWMTPDGQPFCLQKGDDGKFDEWQLVELVRNVLR